jgi:hypothetical protein
VDRRASPRRLQYILALRDRRARLVGVLIRACNSVEDQSLTVHRFYHLIGLHSFNIKGVSDTSIKKTILMNQGTNGIQ